ncbi:MAG TPA: lysophospholipid acyltransferase family protein [Anaerolineae bacterium]|jgi:lauroyl/myristoyl acyltransferase|nr:lysophospholipid acyltransferase family protein [Anaerolineae bacterium]
MLNYLGYFFYRLGEAIAVRLSMPGAYRLAERIAWLYWVFHRRSRATMLTNMRQVLGPGADEAAVRRTARAGFNHFAYGVADFFRQPRLLEGELDQLIVSVHGEEYLDEALAAGRGGILMIAHMGPWEAAGTWIARRGVSVTPVALTHEAPQIERFFVSRRDRGGYQSVPLGKAARELLRTIQRGEMVVLAADRNFTEFGTWAEFLGRQALMPDGHVRLALRTGAPIIPALVQRDENLKARIVFEPPITLRKGQDDVQTGVRRCLEVLERYIRLYPEQWMAMSRIWPEE